MRYEDGERRAPLADMTVLAVEQFGAGPWGTRQLSDLGATVIKVEDPATGGDVGRYVPPYRSGEDSLFFETFNAGKRSISLDLKSPAGRAVLEDLVAGADVLACNLRGDQPARLGLTYDALAHRNRRLVFCSLSGFGMTGPRAAEPAYDYVLQALSGWMALTGEPDGPPTKSGLSLVDFCAGYAAALTIAAAVWRARRDGVGGDCDLSLYEVALSLLTYVGTWAATEGHEPARHGESSHPSIVPFQAFQAADGWLTVACAKEKFWRRYCDVAGLAELVDDERFADMTARLRNRDELLAILRPRMRERPVAAWVETLKAAGVPVGEVRGLPAALRDPQIEARGGIRSYAHPALGEVRQVASPLRISGHEAPARPAPARGADLEPVLRELCGYDDERIAAARAQGAFGSRDAGVAAG